MNQTSNENVTYIHNYTDQKFRERSNTALSVVLLCQNYFKTLILEIRKELNENPDAYACEKNNFSGGCIMASSMFIERATVDLTKRGYHVSASELHGELRHNPTICSHNWSIEHSMVSMKINGIRLYIDPTCGQFKEIINDISDYYIGYDIPKWFYPDHRNPLYGKNKFLKAFTQTINKLKITRHYSMHDRNIIIREGLYEFIVYSIWGSISNVIHNIFYRH